MLKINVDPDIIDYAIKQVNTYNFGQRSYGNGTKEQQKIGIIGQSQIHRILHKKLPSGENGYDGGVDLWINGVGVDVKTMTRKVPMRPSFAHNIFAAQINYDVGCYLFCSYNTTNQVLTVCGSAPKDYFLEKAVFYPAGSFRARSDGTNMIVKWGLYEIAQTDIIPINSIADIELLTPIIQIGY